MNYYIIATRKQGGKESEITHYTKKTPRIKRGIFRPGK